MPAVHNSGVKVCFLEDEGNGGRVTNRLRAVWFDCPEEIGAAGPWLVDDAEGKGVSAVGCGVGDGEAGWSLGWGR